MSDPVQISAEVWSRINQDAQEATRIVDERFARTEENCSASLFDVEHQFSCISQSLPEKNRIAFD